MAAHSLKNASGQDETTFRFDPDNRIDARLSVRSAVPPLTGFQSPDGPGMPSQTQWICTYTSRLVRKTILAPSRIGGGQAITSQGFRFDMERQYNNQAHVPEHLQIMDEWARKAAAFRSEHVGATLDVACGPGQRNTYDLFQAASGTAAQ